MDDDRLRLTAEAVNKLVQGQLLPITAVSILVPTRQGLSDAAKGIETRGLEGQYAAAPARVHSGLSMIATQTCDLQDWATLGGRQTMHVAPVIILDKDDPVARNAKRQTTPRFIHVKWLPTEATQVAVADLDWLSPIDRAVVIGMVPGPKPAATDRRQLEHALGRPWSRPALPDNVVRAVKPIRDKVTTAKNDQTTRILDEALYQIRVTATDELAGLGVTVHLIPYPQWHPDVISKQPSKTPKLTVENICQRMCDTYDSLNPGSDDPANLVWLWHQLASALTASCAQALGKARQTATEPPVVSITVELTLMDHELVAGSDILDLSHMSIDSSDAEAASDPAGDNATAVGASERQLPAHSSEPVGQHSPPRESVRCGAAMPRAHALCGRRAGHPGPHRRK